MKRLPVRLLTALAVIAILSTAVVAARPAVAASAPDACSYAAHFVADVTVRDNTVMAAGASFVKTWRIQNDGNCSWGPGYPLHTLVFAGGTNLAGAFTFELPSRVDPGQQADLFVPMNAAIYPGRWTSQWKLKADDGQVIGFGASGQAAIYVLIVVPENGPSSGGICSYYTVQPGDWLSLIAARFGTTWEAIAQVNHLYNPNWIYAGMRLAIPCVGGSVPPGGQTGSFTSNLYHYTVTAPAGWTVSVNTSIPGGQGSKPEYVTFSAPGGSLPQIHVDVLTGAPPITGFENCEKNLVFRGLSACSLSMPRGQNPAQHLLVFRRGDTYFHIAMLYESSGEMADWDSFLRSWNFTE